MLNGGPMYDILPILKEIKRADPDRYNKLEQAMQWPSSGVNVSRTRGGILVPSA